MSSPRDRVAFVALSQRGVKDPAPYWLDVLDPPQAHPVDAKGVPLSWCGAFALYCLHQSGLALDWKWKPRVGFLYRLPGIIKPRRGDLVYRKANQHHGVVIEDDGTTVEGNSTGGAVVLHPPGKWDAAYSIEPLLWAPSDAETPAQALQRQLTAAGYPCGAIDGKVGKKTTGALCLVALEHPGWITISRG